MLVLQGSLKLVGLKVSSLMAESIATFFAKIGFSFGKKAIWLLIAENITFWLIDAHKAEQKPQNEFHDTENLSSLDSRFILL
ncbi:hypothetical protein VB712_10360 [Spirulina sp. CCNP1310]|nr:hypothetical protein [Spirulina sp. CCNP1310]